MTSKWILEVLKQLEKIARCDMRDRKNWPDKWEGVAFERIGDSGSEEQTWIDGNRDKTADLGVGINK